MVKSGDPDPDPESMAVTISMVKKYLRVDRLATWRVGGRFVRTRDVGCKVPVVGDVKLCPDTVCVK